MYGPRRYPSDLRPPKDVHMDCSECEYSKWTKKEYEHDSKHRCYLYGSGKGKVIQNRWTTPSWCPKKEKG